MAREEFKVELTAEDQISPELRNVLTALEDVTAEAKATAIAAEALGQALGPELAAKADTTAIVQDLQKAGVTLDDITANADQLAGKLREVSDADVGGKLGANLGTARGEMDQLRNSSDQTRSVMANLTGNAAQDLGALAGVGGSAGVALGQLAEYATEGNVSLGNLVKLAGPMAGVALAVQGITGHFKKMADIKAFQTDQVDAYTESIRAGADAAQALTDRLVEASEVKTLDILGDEQDLTPKLAAAGVSVEQWSRLVTGSREELDAWAVASVEAGGDVDALKQVVFAAQQEQKLFAQSQIQAAIQTEVFGETAEMTAGAVDAATEASIRHQLAMLGEGAAALETVDALNEAITATTEMGDARRAAADAGFAARDAEKDFAEQIVETYTQLAEAPGITLENRDALDDLAESAGKAADSQVRLQEEQMASMGATQSAEEAQHTWNASMLTSARTTDGPMRDAIVNYIAEVNGIPPEKVSDILANPDYATIDEAAGALDTASADRDAQVTLNAVIGNIPTAAEISAMVGVVPIHLEPIVRSLQTIVETVRVSGARSTGNQKFE